MSLRKIHVLVIFLYLTKHTISGIIFNNNKDVFIISRRECFIKNYMYARAKELKYSVLQSIRIKIPTHLCAHVHNPTQHSTTIVCSPSQHAFLNPNTLLSMSMECAHFYFVSGYRIHARSLSILPRPSIKQAKPFQQLPLPGS